MNRRKFLARVVKIFSGLIAGLFAIPVWSFIRSSFTSARAESAYPIANLRNLQDEVTRVTFTRLVRDGWMVRTAEQYVWVRKNPDGTVRAYEPHCTHLGCAYDWDAKTKLFQCPCHGGKFNAEGKRVAGPPPRDLDRFEIKLVNGEVRIGKLVKG